jgi:lipoyl(octanoyl) transferase
VTFRLLVTEPLDGARNMAIDEALLRARIAGDGPPTVRFYAWAPPTVSLGYGQALDATIDLQACRRLGIGLVRRPTGGSAILHESPAAEVTYSVVARGADFEGADDLLETYRVLGNGLAAGLAHLGLRVDVAPRRPIDGAAPTFCFARTGAHELAVAGRKLAGSAQRRQGGALLQHGSILLDVDPARLQAVFLGLADPLATVTSLAQACGRRVLAAEVIAALGAGLAEALGHPLTPGGLSAPERSLVARLLQDKYATEGWTRQGVAPAIPAVTTGLAPRA